jgi:hydrogenase maturation protease
MTTNTLILGIGNDILSDEGAGIHALNYIQQRHPNLENVTYLNGGTLSFSLASWVEDADNIIVLDAAELKANPGTVKIFENEKLDKFATAAKRSVHEVGLMDLLDITRMVDALPEKRALIGIQAQNFDWGLELTPEVKKSLPIVEQAVLDLLDKWSN